MNEFILNEVNPVKSVKLKGKIVGKKRGRGREIGDDGVIDAVSLLEASLWRFDLLVRAHCLACGVQSGDGGGGVMIG